jgi:8-oxo-dGTP pyrophosphatase MutT (NUDIX family)
VLLVRRSNHPPFPSAWVFPGGKVDQLDDERGGSRLEAPSAAAARELQEEVGVAVRAEDLVPLWELSTHDSDMVFTVAFFEASMLPGGQIRVDGNELVAYEWGSAGDMLDADRDIPAATRETLKRLSQRPDLLPRQGDAARD